MHIPNLEIEFVDSKIMNQLTYEVSKELIENEGFKFELTIKEAILDTIEFLKKVMNNIYFPLVISCSVEPQVQVALNDSKERLIQYKKSIKDWSESNSFSKIILVENTGNSLLSDAELSNYRKKGVEIEQIVYGPEKNVSERGASWGSARIYENAIKESYFVRESDYFATTTGRTFIPNVNSLLKEFDKNHNKTYVNRWLQRGYKRFNPGRADLRFVIWNKNFFTTKISAHRKIE